MNKLPIFSRGRIGNINFAKDEGYFSRWYFFLFVFLIIIGFIVLSLRLFQLTVVKGEYYRMLSDDNRIREIPIEAKRGTILDRKGFVLAESTQPPVAGGLEQTISKRVYQSPEIIAPVVGYRQIADPQDIANDPCKNKLIPNEKVGKKGVERLYDCELRGVEGKKLVEVDAQGKYLRTLAIVPPQSGKTIQLALDLALQQKAYDLIKGKKAAVVAMIPQTGEVTVLASTPSYNPQAFENQDNELIRKYLADPQRPLFNRTTEGTYPPGSIFKLVLAAGALQTNTIDEKYEVEDKGILHAGPLTFGNWYYLQYGKTEGMVNIVKAIQRSNDIFFYTIGNLLGPDKIKQWADILGYEKPTGIGFEEASGLIPSPFWKQETLHDRWYTGDTYNMSIGQGYTLVTPLQVNQVTAAIANNGTLCTPQLLKNAKPDCKKLPISDKNIALIQEGMQKACTTGGTGWPFFDFKIAYKQEPTPTLLPGEKTSTESAKITYTPIQISCKTGTAESTNKTSDNPHAWITGYAPSQNPQIAITVLIENGGQGSDVAGPIARDLLTSYFERSD